VTRADKRQRQKERSRAAREARESAAKRQQRKSMAIRLGAGLVVVALAIGLAALVTGGNDDDSADATTTVPSTAPTPTTVANAEPATATITTNFGDIVVELDTSAAPVASAHFIELAEQGFYDGLAWHRVVPDFVIQGGDPNGDGTGGSGSPVTGEVPVDNYPVGSLAAAKAANDPPGTFDSQFFIVTGEQGATLPNDYARFGTVVSGIEVAQQIEALAPPEGDGAPTQPATIERITITRGDAAGATTTTTTPPG
jgi:cyclophilin family peptidyl-prolyl cis-trans isomerase